MFQEYWIRWYPSSWQWLPGPNTFVQRQILSPGAYAFNHLVFFIQPQIRDLQLAFQLRTILASKYRVVNSFEPYELVSQIEHLTFADARSAVVLIRRGIIIRGRQKTISNTLLESYWISAILRKLLPYYQLEAQFLITLRNITLDQVHNYFAECVFDSFEPRKAKALHQITAPSDALYETESDT